MNGLNVTGGSSPISRGFDTEDPSSSPNSSPVNPDGSRVFGSLTIDRNSSTPYTDATQVRRFFLSRVTSDSLWPHANRKRIIFGIEAVKQSLNEFGPAFQ